MVELTGFQKRGEFIKGLSELKVKIGEEEKSYFDNDFLIQRFLGMNPDMIKSNANYKDEESKQAEKAGGEGGEAEGAEAGGTEGAEAGGTEPEATTL